MTEKKKTIAVWSVLILGFLIAMVMMVPDLDTAEEFTILPENEQPANVKFDVAAPQPRPGRDLWSRNFLFELAGSDKITGPQREAKLSARYEELWNSTPDGVTPRATVDTTLGVAVVEIDGKPFATVLPQDCPEYLARLSDADKLQLETEVAYSWRNEIQDDLNMKALKRHPAYLKIYNYLTVLGFFAVGMLHLTLNWISRRWLRKPLWSVKALVWVTYLTLLTTLHPSLDDLANLLTRGALRPLFLFIITSVGVGVAHQMALLLLHRYFIALAEYDHAGKITVRTAQRRKTIEQAAVFLSQVVWVFLGLCVYLYALGVNLTSFFAGAGLIGVAIGVMARDIFLDYINGMNIIVEDQFGVGDWIESNTDSGEVVSFSLRATKLRRTDGGLATVPNSDLRRVKNHSNEWSQVDYQVSVTYRTNVDIALAYILEETAQLEAEFPEKILEPARALGVQELANDGVVLRVLIKTAPLTQWDVKRRLNRRVKQRFDAEGIDFAAPRLAIQVRPTGEREACSPTASVLELDD